MAGLGHGVWHSGLPFSVLSAPYSANGNGIVQGSGPQYASVIPGVPLYEHNPIPGVTEAGTVQWLNPDAFVSSVDPSTEPVTAVTAQPIASSAISAATLARTDFFWSDLYLTKWFPLKEHVKLRVDAQFFNVLNHPSFGLPVVVNAGFRASLPPRPDSERSATQLRRLRDYWAWAGRR